METKELLSIASTVVMALIGWGLKNQISALKSEFQTQLVAMRGEFQKALSDSEVRFFERVNGKYVRSEILDLRLANLQPLCRECVSKLQSQTASKESR